MELVASWGAVDLVVAGDIVSDWLVDGAPDVQVASAMRRAAAGSINRGNVQHTVAFTVKLAPKASPLAAAQFTADHAIALAAITDAPALEFSLGDKDYSLASAVVVKRTPALMGCTITYTYQITGGALTDVTPP